MLTNPACLRWLMLNSTTALACALAACLPFAWCRVLVQRVYNGRLTLYGCASNDDQARQRHGAAASKKALLPLAALLQRPATAAEATLPHAF